MAGWWFSPGTLVSSNPNPDLRDIAEIVLKVALNAITISPIIHVYVKYLCKFSGDPVDLELLSTMQCISVRYTGGGNRRNRRVMQI